VGQEVSLADMLDELRLVEEARGLPTGGGWDEKT